MLLRLKTDTYGKTDTYQKKFLTISNQKSKKSNALEQVSCANDRKPIFIFKMLRTMLRYVPVAYAFCVSQQAFCMGKIGFVLLRIGD